MNGEEKEKLEKEIVLLIQSSEINKFNYNLFSSMFFTGIIMIFTIVQLMITVFPVANKISFFIAGLFCYSLFAFFIYFYRLKPENKSFTIKYNLIKEKYSMLGINVLKLEKDILRLLK
jgi:hypothetical protein